MTRGGKDDDWGWRKGKQERIDQAHPRRWEMALGTEECGCYVNMHPGCFSREKDQAREAGVEQRRAVCLNEELDGTDLACIAWWRGDDHGLAVTCKLVGEYLDGKAVGGVSSEPWESTRRRVAGLVEEVEGYRKVRVVAESFMPGELPVPGTGSEDLAYRLGKMQGTIDRLRGESARWELKWKAAFGALKETLSDLGKELPAGFEGPALEVFPFTCPVCKWSFRRDVGNEEPIESCPRGCVPSEL